jgi:alkaline phosphatase
MGISRFGRTMRTIAAIGLAVTCLTTVGPRAEEPNQEKVIVLMFDGAGAGTSTVARWYKGGDLHVDRMYVSAVRTYGSNSLITDSAPAATAFACGVKSADKFVGVMPDEITIPSSQSVPADQKFRPVASVLEGARLAGKATGLVATSNIQHASPAGYSAHTHNRGDYLEIAEQQVYGDIDVVLGGGGQYLLPVSLGGRRTDGENLVQELQGRGFAYVTTRDELEAFSGRKVWGMFATDSMYYELDRPRFAPDEPSLGEMTARAIEILNRDPDGFFLFVEGSKVDWANHANDPVGSVTDFLAFDEAVGKALDFAARDGHTLVLVFADHATGGMSLGNASTSSTYSKLPLTAVVPPLKAARLTGEGVELALGTDRSESNVREVLEEDYGIADLTADEVSQIQAAPAGYMNGVVGPMISRRSCIGWTTTGHTGEDIPLWYFGLETPMKVIENTRIAHLCAERMGFDLSEVTDKLYREAGELFATLGASVAIDQTDPANKALVVTKGSKSARLPFAKDILTITDGSRQKTHPMKGVTVYASRSGKVYVPKQARTLFQEGP